MSYIENNLLEQETIIFQVMRHWIIFILPASLFVLALIFLSIGGLWLILAVLFLVLALVQWFAALVTYLTSEFAITNKRIIMKIGFIRRFAYETLLQRVASVQVYQSILGRVLGYGTIIIYDTGGSKEVFLGIDNAILFRRNVQQQIENTLNYDSEVVRGVL